MSKDKISDYSATANSNTDIGGINIDEGCAPSGINDAIRTLMKQLKDWQSGSQDVYIHPAGSASVPSITATGDTNTGLFFPAADTVGITTGGTERARVDSSGNLGLGVTPSAWASGTYKALQVSGGGAISGSTGQVNFSQNWVGESGADKYISNGFASSYSQVLGTHKWYTAASGTAGNAISFTQAMTLDASGNLIVNGTSPVGKLTVSGQSTDANNVLTGANITAGTQLCLRERGNSAGISGLTYTEQIYSGPAGGALELYTVQATPVVFGTSATERARIDSSGNLLLMTTSSSITADVGIKFVNGSSGNAYMGIVNSQSTNASANYHLYSTGASAYRFYVGMGGTIYATSTSISALSDQTLKTNIRDLETGLTEVMALKPRRFDWINGDATNVAGFVAQEVEQVLPELVTDYIHNKDEEGNDITKKSLKMGDILPTLVKAIQEQQAIITQLQADVAALKGQA